MAALVPRYTWRDAFADWRHRLISDPRFQRFAARFPLTRPLVREKANALFDMTAGFVYSQILHACVELSLFSDLAPGALSIHELASRHDLSEARMRLLLDGAAALGLIEKRGDDHYALGEMGACILGTPGLAEMIRHHALFYRDLTDPIALLREDNPETELNRYWAYARPNAEGRGKEGLRECEVGEYSELMASSQGFIAEDVLDAFDLSRFERLSDIGGGHGAFMRAVLRRHSGLDGVVFDLPPVAARANVTLARFGGRARAQGGDFFTDDLPGSPVMSLIRVLYDHQDDNALRILRNVWRAMPPGGTLLLAEPMAGVRGSEAMGSAYFGFYLLAMGGGRSRSFSDLARLAEKSGFSDIRAHKCRRPLLVSVMTAQKPCR